MESRTEGMSSQEQAHYPQLLVLLDIKVHQNSGDHQFSALVEDEETLARRLRIKKLGQRILESQVFSLLTCYLDFKQAIQLQLLNKMMYHRKIPQMFGTIYGSRIEECIIIYSIYKDRKNAVSVLVGKKPSGSMINPS